MNPISTTAMAALLESGQALALLPGGVPGPVRHRGRWWAVPIGEQAYQLVTDPATLAMLEDSATRAAAALAAVARAHQRG